MARHGNHTLLNGTFVPCNCPPARHALPWTEARIAFDTQPVSVTQHVNAMSSNPKFTPADSRGDAWDTRGRTL